MKRFLNKKCKSRRAAAAVEMAIIAPILLTMLFGIVEYGWISTVRQALVTATREAARTAALPGSTTSEIEERVQEYLDPLGLEGYEIETTRSTPDVPTETVRVTIPYGEVTLVGGYFGSTDWTLGAVSSMRKEGLD